MAKPSPRNPDCEFQSNPSSVAINGFALRVIRERTGIKVTDLAAGLECDRSYITKLEIGTSKRVSVDFYRRLLDQLAISDHRTLLATPAFTESVA
ncbi:helix-turn-helix domain-containing protein [Mycolicibacterium gilvum]|uniref:helix-turn-helix domain-containing protein n=1 Tax=Mycolicibacterium gilvum TaxID=1804 RepID=UPI0040462E52